MTHPSALTWFEFHARALPLAQWAAFRWHALRCSECGTRLGRELAERAAFEAAPARRWWLVLVPLAAAASLLLLLPTGGSDLTPKGGSRFEIWVGGTQPLGSRCAAGDALQARASSTRRYLLVVGVDPHGATRTLYPLDGAQSASLASGPMTLPQSWTLDAEPGRERFVALFSDAPVSAADAHRAAAAGTPALEWAEVIVRECVKEPR